MIKRTLSADFLNRVANDPEVRPWLGEGPAEIDLSQVIANHLNIALEAPHGGWVLINQGDGAFELHTMFLPAGRGASYARHAQLALQWLFTRTEAVEIRTKIPDTNLAANTAARLAGFHEVFRREGIWDDGEGNFCGCSFQKLTIDDWIMGNAHALAVGKEFHANMDAQREEHAKHPDDDVHNRYAGAAVMMMTEGLIGKAISVYNRWAVFAGYVPIKQIGLHLIDIGDAVIEIIGADYTVLLVR